MTPGLLISLLLATAAPGPAREQRPTGFALAPALAFHDVAGEYGGDGFIMPLGLAVDRMFGAGWSASLSVARFPASYTPITHLHLGARRYLLESALSPYLAADLGMEWEDMESGETRRSPSLITGAGVEWASRGGLLLAADGSIGPQYTNTGGPQRDWQLLGRVRLLVGFRM